MSHFDPRISVVIPTYQRCASIERALRALGRQTFPPDRFEVVVSVDGSDDGTLQMLERIPTPYALRSIWNPNAGRAVARNRGVAVARGSLLILLDDDMEPGPKLIEAHARAHSEQSRLAVLGPVPVAVEPTSSSAVQHVGTKFNRHLRVVGARGYEFKLRDFYGGNVSLRRELLEEVGGFDEAFTGYGNEDIELSIRLRAAGVRFLFEPEAWARQHYAKTFPELARDNIAKGESAVLLARKHPAALPELKLSTYAHHSWKWRALRAVLLRLTELRPATAHHVIRFVDVLARRQPSRLHAPLSLVLDYLFWVGARSAQRHERAAGP